MISIFPYAEALDFIETDAGNAMNLIYIIHSVPQYLFDVVYETVAPVSFKSSNTDSE